MSRSLYARLARRFGPRADAVSRREMLRRSVATGAGLLLSSSLTGCASSRPKPISRIGEPYRVVVIGGGYSGLACAHELRAADIEVVVLEARNRVGGRVVTFTDMVPGKTVEGGGELIGSNHPTWLAYADRFNLRMLPVSDLEDLSYPIVLDGVRLTDDEAEALYLEMTQALLLVNYDAAQVNAEQPWTSPFAKELDRRSTAEWLDELRASDRCKRAIRAQLTADNGVPLERQSYLANLAAVKGGGVDRYWTDSEVFRCAGGNQQLAERLADGIGRHNVRTGVRVRAIESTPLGARVHTSDGGPIDADEVVLAVPPSVWRDMRLSPALPDDFTPQMGVSVKYLGAVKRRFWLDSRTGPETLTDGDVALTWEATDNQTGDPPGPGACLVAFSGGAQAEACRRRHRESRGRFYTTELDALYPGYASNRTKARFMDWPADRLTKGGYSFPAPGEVTTIGPLLQQPFAKRIHFAGEHCCYRFVGYMEGALTSGAEVARRIATGRPVAERAVPRRAFLRA